MAAEGASSQAEGTRGQAGGARAARTESETLLANGTAQGEHSLGGGGDAEGQRTRGSLDGSFWLAACSAVGGCSCVGIYAVLNAVRASERRRYGDVESAEKCRRRAVRFSALSFGACVGSVLLALAFVVLLSYLIRWAR